MGTPRTPNEILRKRGGHGHGWRLSSVTPPAPVLPRGAVPATPPRGLGKDGRNLWKFVVAVAPDWLAESDVPVLRQACETIDEVARLSAAAQDTDDPMLLLGLTTRAQNARKLHIQLLSLLGFSPADRAKYNLGEVAQEEDPLEAFRRGNTA